MLTQQIAKSASCMALLLLTACLRSPVPAETAAPAEKHLIEVELTQGTNMAVALSPDGTQIAIALQGVLWTLPALGGVATAITPPELDAHEPAWSPDGQRLVFYAFAEDGFSVWMVGVDGAGLQPIIETPGDARYPSFTPDGKNIIYSSDEDADGYQAWSYEIETGERAVLTTPAESGYETPVAPYFSGSGNVVYPIVSPDGKTLAFVLDGEMDALVVRDLSDTSQLRVIHAAKTLGAPAWSPDSQALWLVGINDAQAHLAQIDLQTEPATVTKKVDRGDIFPFRPSVTADASILYSADGDIRALTEGSTASNAIPFSATVELDRTPYTRRTYDLSDTTPRRALGIVDPVLSPDGQKTVFSALGDLWIADLPDGVPTRLTDDPFIDLSPSWSPDGQDIAFVSDRGGKADLWVLSPATGDMKQVADSALPVSAPSWSPDGTKLAFLSDFALSVFVGATVNVLDLGNDQVTTLSGPIFGPSAPVWAPDASRVAVIARQTFTNRFREGHNAILLLSADGSAEQIWASPVDGKSLGRRHWNRLAWAADGTIVYRLDGALWTAEMSSSGEIGPAQQIAESGENPVWSDDGTMLIYLDGAALKRYNRVSGQTELLTVQPEWAQAMPSSDLTIRAGLLFDGTGEAYQSDVDIIVRGGVIEAIHPMDSQPIVGTLIDASDQTVIPGLIEAHTHQSTNLGITLGELWLEHGITTVRETGDDPYHAVERREAVASGRRPGPRVFTAGPLNEGARISYGVSETVGTAQHAETALRLSDELQLDMVKSYVRQDYSIQKAMIAGAHKSGVPVSSHELYPSVAYGIDNIEHFGATSRRGYSLKLSRLGRSYQDVVALIAASGVIVTPTLALSSGNGTRDIPGQQRMLKQIVDAGGNIIAGTDSPFVPFAASLHTELAIYAEAGLTPAQVLRMATSETADALGVGDQLGRIVPGALADIVILDGDPLSDITHTRMVSKVFQNGQLQFDNESSDTSGDVLK